ncbi:MAG TPA: diaminopimelate decarboxylase [Terriglobales bacterium]|nr:diaminopimelate decarboxylase [Terriglobales bacterium]
MRKLHCERLPLNKLAEQYGTPLYVYSGSTVRSRYQAFDAAFDSIPHLVCYSVKANSNLSILRMLSKMRSGFDIVSGGELERVLVADKKAAERVVFSGVGKTAPEMDLALRSGILMFNVESTSEVELLANRASRLKKHARVAVRVNPDVFAETHPYISTGLRKHKFGVPIEEARGLYRTIARHRYLKASGVSVHIGSQITSVGPFGDAMQRVADFVGVLRSDGHQIDYIDAGGGLGIQYHEAALDTFPEKAKTYAVSISKPLAELGVTLLLEPGRSIIGPAGALLTRVLYHKQNDGKQFLIVDAAMNDLIRPTLYSAHHEIVPVDLAPDAKTATYDVVGPICETGDFFARDRELPVTGEGQLLAILDAGAYGMSIASNYNTRSRPPEVLVDGKKVRLIRRRETVRDQVRIERKSL